MIVVEVFAQDSPEVSFVEDDHMIETLAPNASNDPFDVGALPRGARRRRNLLDVESRNAPFEVRPVDSIPVSQHVTRRRIPRKGIDDLLVVTLGTVRCRERLGGLLRFYHREAA